MLALTQDAAEAVRTILNSIDDELPAGSGLRIDAESADADGTNLSISVVAGPTSGDETVTEHGARVYLSADASQLLSDKVLDAHSHEDHVHFTIGEQGEEPAPHDHGH